MNHGWSPKELREPRGNLERAPGEPWRDLKRTRKGFPGRGPGGGMRPAAERRKKLSRSERIWCSRAFLCGAALSLLWGGITWLLRLDQVFSNEAQQKLFDMSLPARLLFLCVLSPVLEELIFRGALFSLLSRKLPRRASAVVVSVLFALWHGNVIQILYAFPMGMVLQYFLEKGRSLKAPAACHIGANLTAVTVEALLR